MKKTTYLLSILMACFMNATNAQWTKHCDLPPGGPIIDMTADNNGTIYVLTGYYGLIFYTTTNGTTWIPLPNVNSTWSITDIEVDKVSGKLYAAGGGIFSTSDKGQNWQQFTYTVNHQGFPSIGPIYKLGVKHGQHTITARGDDITFISTNDGNSWNPHSGNIFSYVYEMEFLSNGDVLAGDDFGIRRSTDNGATWLPTTSTGISNKRIISIAGKPGSNYVFAAAVENLYGDTINRGVYMSSDGGFNWTLSNLGAAGRNVNNLTVDSSTGVVYAATETGLYASANNGGNWSLVNSNLQEEHVVAVVITSTGFFAGTHGTGVATAQDPAQGWTYVNNGLYTTASNSLHLMANGDLYMLDGNTASLRIRNSANGSWQQPGGIVTPYTRGAMMKKDNSGTLYKVVTVYTASIGGPAPQYKLLKSTNTGNTWSDLTPGLAIPATAMSHKISDLDVAANGDVYVLVFVKMNVSNEYSMVLRAPAGSTAFTNIMQTPINGNIVSIRSLALAGNGTIYMAVGTSQSQNEVAMTTNMGQTVTAVPTNISNMGSNFRLEIDRNDSLYVINSSNIYKHSGAGSWNALPNGGWTGTDFNIYFDNDNDIYVTTGLQAPTKGVFYSSTGGSSWQNKSAGLPVYSFAGNNLVTLDDLQFDAQDNVFAYTLDFRPEAASLPGIYKMNAPSPTNISSVSLANATLTLSPNPANRNTVQLSGYGERAPGTIRVFDNQGRMIRHIENPSPATMGTVKVDLTGMTGGIYFIEAQWNDKKLTGKLVKE